MNLNNDNRRPPKDIGFGFMGLFLAIIVIIFNVIKFIPSFLYIIPLFYFAGFLNCVFIKKYLSGIGWLLQGIAFLVGYYIYGRIGIFVALFIAFVIITPIINRYEEKINFKNMFKFLNAVKYINSSDRFEYEALKRDSKKEKSNLVLIIVSNLLIIILFATLFYRLFFLSLIAILILLGLSFLNHYLKLYHVLQNQLGNPFFRNKKS